MHEKALIGCLLGTAVGDALGLPYEGLSSQRAVRMFSHRDRYHFFWGRGMVSDDTEHACMTAQALIEARDDAQRFTRRLARRLRWWLLGLPAGVGFATLRALLRLWFGISPARSGVFSAGNGPAMRSVLIGIYFGENYTKMREFVRASTRITHTDPKAFWGALAVAVAASMSCSGQTLDGERYIAQLRQLLSAEKAEEFLDHIRAASTSCQRHQETQAFAASLGLEHGVSGYVYHTVPVVIHAWLSSPHDFRTSLLNVIACGGDTDTTAAILGGILGSRVGKQGIPPEWLKHLWEWPRSVAWMESLGRQLANPAVTQAPRLPLLGILGRNIVFLWIVLLHGFRRLFPPY